MRVSQTDVIPATLAETTLLTIRESNSYNRIFTFKNLCTAQLTLSIEYSADGGTTWSTAVASFNLTSGAIATKQVTHLTILRIRGSGETNSIGVMLSFDRSYLDATHVWTSPVV